MPWGLGGSALSFGLRVLPGGSRIAGSSDLPQVMNGWLLLALPIHPLLITIAMTRFT
jgi:hypothetical protein